MVQESKPRSTKPKSRKFAGSLAALSAAAVISIYTVGYASTASSIDDLAAQIPTAAATTSTTTTSALPAGTPAPSTAAGRTAPLPTATAAPSTSGKYVDGTYAGTGNSRHGSITATVVIAGGKITSASVTNCATRYPCSDVDALVKATVANQGVPTSNVSGATDSSNAYKTAVSSALQKALTGV